MESPTTTNDKNQAAKPSGRSTNIIEPDFSQPMKRIAELVALPDFPQCALGEHVDIGGYTGVIIEIVKQSIKVRSPESTTNSFNVHGLRKLYSRPAPLEFGPPASEVPAPTVVVELTVVAPPPKKREVIAEPNFDRDVKAIRIFASRSDFPQCAFGEYVDIRGYAGVVVDIVNQSLKVRAPDGVVRDFDASVLRKLYGRS